VAAQEWIFHQKRRIIYLFSQIFFVPLQLKVKLTTKTMTLSARILLSAEGHGGNQIDALGYSRLEQY
jgi:hypothetical protein